MVFVGSVVPWNAETGIAIMRLWISQAVISEARVLLSRQLQNADRRLVGHDLLPMKPNEENPSFTNPVAITLQRTFDDPTAHCGKETVRVQGVEYKTGDNFKRFMKSLLKGQEKPDYVTIHEL